MQQSPPTGAVTISGLARQGGVLTVANTLADPDGLGTLAYQWLRDGTAVPGATGLTYTLGQADVGARISVRVSYTDGFGTPESVASAATTPVSNVNDAPTGAVTISGLARQGGVLTAANTLADPDGLGTLAYQWLRDGTAVPGATNATYLLKPADVGSTIAVRISYTDSFGTSEVVISASTAAVSADPTATISGTEDSKNLLGTPGNDLIDAGQGDDSVTGAGGIDKLVGADGNDVLIGDSRGLYYLDESAQVYRMYDTVFGRAPDGGGHHTWTLTLLGGTTLTEVAAAFVASPEFQRTYGNTTNADFVTLLYQNVLDRPPSAEDRDFWVGRLDTTWTRTDLVLFFSESAEHVRKTAVAQDLFDETRDITNWGDDVYRLYRAIFDRDPDGGGFNTWTGSLSSGNMTLPQVIESFMASPEFQSTYGAATSDTEFVTLLYLNVLKRAPDAGGLQGWIDALEGGMERAKVVGFFLSSLEFVNGTRDDMVTWMQARFPDDVLDPGPGDAVVSGGAYADTFVFTNDGQASEVIVTDVEAWDTLDFSDFGLTQAQVLAALEQQGEDVVFASGGETVVFKDTLLAEVTQDMILV
ncbi:hypothetical protein A9320_08560 [Ruegeria sp. PBVC088]|nr:hypothetical protein A9320_08560 [Ruegeria sp. PBVC088]